jgi:hypothetical protein
MVSLNLYKTFFLSHERLLKDNSILYYTTHRKAKLLDEGKLIHIQLLFLTIYTLKRILILVLKRKNELTLKFNKFSKFIIYYSNDKYLNYAKCLNNIELLSDASHYNKDDSGFSFPQNIYYLLNKSVKLLLCCLKLSSWMFQRNKFFKKTSFVEIIHAFRTLETLLDFELVNDNNDKSIILLALTNDVVASALHHYSNVRVISFFFEYLHTNAIEFKNYNLSLDLFSINRLQYINSKRIGAIPSKFLSVDITIRSRFLYIIDTCDIEDILYNDYRKKMLQSLYQNLYLRQINCVHVIHPGLSRSEYLETLRVIPNEVKVVRGLAELDVISPESLVIGFHSSALLSFVYLKVKVLVFKPLENAYFEDQFEIIPDEIVNFNIMNEFVDHDYKQDKTFDSFSFFDFTELKSHLVYLKEN